MFGVSETASAIYWDIESSMSLTRPQGIWCTYRLRRLSAGEILSMTIYSDATTLVITHIEAVGAVHACYAAASFVFLARPAKRREA